MLLALVLKCPSGILEVPILLCLEFRHRNRGMLSSYSKANLRFALTHKICLASSGGWLFPGDYSCENEQCRRCQERQESSTYQSIAHLLLLASWICFQLQPKPLRRSPVVLMGARRGECLLFSQSSPFSYILRIGV